MLVLRVIVYAFAFVCCKVCVSYYMRVYIACVCLLSCFRVVCACVLVLRAIVYASGVVCCKVAFHIARVFILHVCVAFVCWGIFLYACLLVLLAVLYACALVCCNVAFHSARVCRLHVRVAFVSLVCSFVLVCLFCV